MAQPDGEPRAARPARITLYETDLRDYISVQRTLEAFRPDCIFHLAAQSFVPASWTGPAETLTTNLLGQTYLFEAVRAVHLDPVIQIACSSEEYGLVLPDEVPIRESNPLRPLLAVCGVEGGAGLPGLPVLPELWHAHRAHARLQPHRAAARRGVRDVELRQAAGVDRAGPRRARAQGRQSRGGARLHRRARHRARVRAGGDSRASRARSTTCRRGAATPSARFSIH